MGWLKLFFKMCGGKIFKTNAFAEVSANWAGRCRVTAELSTEFLSPDSQFESQKSGRFSIRLMVARSSFRLAYNGRCFALGGFVVLGLNASYRLIVA